MTEDTGYRRCLRCNRLFTPTKEGQEYGEKCLRKMAGQTMLQDRYVVPPRKKRRKKSNIDFVDHDDANSEFMTDEERAAVSGIIEIKDEKGEVTAVII